MQVLAQSCEVSLIIPTHEGKRAEGRNYEGLLPAYGLFARNVKELSVENLKVKVHGDEKRQKIVEIND